MSSRHKRPRRAASDQPRRPGIQLSGAALAVLIGALAVGLFILFQLLPPKRSTADNPVERSTPRSAALTEHTAAAVLSNEVPTASGSTNESVALRHLNKGTKLLDQGDLDGAIREYKAALELNRDDEDAYYNLGLAFAKKGDRHAAQKQYREALRIYPDYTEAHNNLGNLLAADGKLDEAVSHLKEAVRLAPEDAVSQNNLGNALARQHKLEEAIPYFRAAVRLKPDYVEAHYNLGVAYLSQQRATEAIAEFENALRLDPDFQPARRELLKAKSRMGKSFPPTNSVPDSR